MRGAGVVLGRKPAFRLKSRSMFQIRSPAFMNSSRAVGTPVGALSSARQFVGADPEGGEEAGPR